MEIAEIVGEKRKAPPRADRGARYYLFALYWVCTEGTPEDKEHFYGTNDTKAQAHMEKKMRKASVTEEGGLQKPRTITQSAIHNHKGRDDFRAIYQKWDTCEKTKYWRPFPHVDEVDAECNFRQTQEEWGKLHTKKKAPKQAPAPAPAHAPAPAPAPVPAQTQAQ